jgi:hypothetical protein
VLHCTAVAETMPAFCEECPVHVLPTLLHPLAIPFDIALCRLAGAVPASLCSAKCGIQRGGDLSSCQARRVGGQSSSPALPHGRSRQGPIGCLPVKSLSQSARTLFTIVQDGWTSFPLQLSCPFTKQSRPSLFPYGPLGQTSYQQQQHLHSLQDRFATSSQAASSSRLTRQADPANESLLMQSILLCNLCLRCDGSVEDEAFLSLRASGSCN